MFARKPDFRFDLNKTKSNILMTQIRAQQKIKHKCQPVFTQRKIQQERGRKVFRQNYYQPTCLYPQFSQLSRSPSPIKKFGKKVNIKNICTDHYENESQNIRPKTGRRMFETNQLLESNSPKISARDQRRRAVTPSQGTYGKRRFDSSPMNQNKVSQNSPFK